jgi:hypothetical protein
MQQTDEEKLFDRIVEVEAKQWGIPKKYWHRAAVRDHVRFCLQARQLQHEISNRSLKDQRACQVSHRHDFWLNDEEISREHDSLINKARLALVRGGHLPAPPLHLTMTQRYRCVELLLRCAIEVLEQGLNGEPIYTGYFKSKLGRAASYYGLDVVDSKPAD